MREPGVHITKGQLAHILRKMGLDSPESVSETICSHAKRFTLSHRSVVSTNQQIEKKAEKVRASSKSEAGLFAQLLVIARRRAHHRGIQISKPGTTEWLTIKEICKLATEFANEFDLPLKEGYMAYLESGLSKMKHFSLVKFKNMHSSICDEYEAKRDIKEDEYPEKTREAHDIYMGMIADRTGNSTGYTKQPEKYKYFVEVRKQAKESGISVKDYIKAQFAALDWANAYPDPAQLVGVKALQRLDKWAYEKNIRLGEKVKTVDFKKLKRV